MQVATRVETLIGVHGERLYCEAHRHPEAKAVVVISHGYAEHSGRYYEVVEALLAAGYSVYLYDWRGHGRSSGLRAYVEKMEYLVDDFGLFVEKVKYQELGKPLFLLGHSTGGGIVLLHALQVNDHKTGLILSAPTIELPINVLERIVAKWLSLFWPRAALIDFVSPTLLTRDPLKLEEAIRDPLRYSGKVRNRTGYEIMRICRRIQAKMHEIRNPLLVFCGTEDKIISLRGIQILMDAVGSVDKTLIEYRNCYHEVFNEINRQEVMEDIVGWLDENCRETQQQNEVALQKVCNLRRVLS